MNEGETGKKNIFLRALVKCTKQNRNISTQIDSLKLTLSFEEFFFTIFTSYIEVLVLTS